MEHIANLVKREQTQTLSEKAKTSTTISRERHAALFAVINKIRMLNGWQTRTAQELDATIRTWDEVMGDVPIENYPELYKRCFTVRQRYLSQGKEPPAFDATLMMSQWLGEYGLKAELRQRQIDERRSLPATAESDCERCYGSGIEVTSRGARGCVCRK